MAAKKTNMPKLFPYATVSRWSLTKTRVFSFDRSMDAQRMPSMFMRVNYKPFMAIDGVYPSHLEDDGPNRFYRQIVSEGKERLKVFKEALSWDSIDTKSNPLRLDQVGDVLSQLIEPSHEIEKKRNYNRVDPELWIAPFWHSVFVDLAILIAECTMEDYSYLNPQMVSPLPRNEPQGYLDFPAIVFDVAAAAKNDPLLEALLEVYKTKTARELENGAWIEIYDGLVAELGLDPAELDSIDYSPDQANRLLDPNRNRPHFYPFEAAWAFLLIGFEKKFIMSDEYYSHSQIALGDCLRQETLPNWSTFPEIPEYRGKDNAER